MKDVSVVRSSWNDDRHQEPISLSTYERPKMEQNPDPARADWLDLEIWLVSE